MKKKILIFIITYKAQKRVYDVFQKINFAKLKKYKSHLLISDDYSNDSTIFYSKEIIKKFNLSKLIINKKNYGYGGNIKKCLKYAIRNKFNYAIMIHGDGQYSPQYIPKLIKLLEKEKFDAATGSRLKSGLKKVISGGMPIYKLLGNIFLTKFFNTVFKSNFEDAHTGLWAYNLKIFKKIKISDLPNNFNFDQLLRINLIKKNFKIGEIPIKTIYADERSQLHIVYAVKFLFITLIYLLRLEYLLKK